MPTFTKDELHKITTAIIRGTGAPEESALQVADILIDNHLAGHDSHGVLRIEEYVKSVRAGEIDAKAMPSILEQSPTSALVNGNWSFGQVTARFATNLAIQKAKQERVAVVSAVKAGHTGRLAAYTDGAALNNVAMFMAIGTVTRPTTAPYGGAAPAVGTNPIAFSIPNPSGFPITLDISTAAIAQGKIKVARAKNEKLPPDVILDRNGKPSTDPQSFFDGGFLLPFGGHKGYGLAVIAEILSGPLVGADAFPGVINRSGIFIFAVDANLFRPQDAYEKALAKTLGRIKGVPPAPGFEEVLLPGELEARNREQRLRNGIPIPERTWLAVCEAGAEVGVDVKALVNEI